MKQLSKEEMKKVIGGLVVYPPPAFCEKAGFPCGDGGTCMAGDQWENGADGCCCTDDGGNWECAS